MAKDIEDPVFGTLTKWQDGDWEFKYYSNLFERELEITIEAGDEYDRELPEECIYSTFKWFHENQIELKATIEKAIFSYYQKVRDEFHQGWGGGEEVDENVPVISNQEEIWKLISGPRVYLSTEYVDLSISFETTWDQEHGITLLFKNEQLFDIE